MRQDQMTFGECSLCRQGELIAMKRSDEYPLEGMLERRPRLLAKHFGERTPDYSMPGG